MAHIHDKIDFTVEVYVVYKDRLLLRKHDKYKVWLSVGGHIELDEDPNQAALREVKEEVGLDVELWDSRRFQDMSDDYYTELIPPISLGTHSAKHPTREDHRHITFVYLAIAHSDVVHINNDRDRSDEWRWFSKDELDEAGLLKNVLMYAHFALDTLSE